MMCSNLTLRNTLVWVPFSILMILASLKILYWEHVQGLHGHSGGGFGPFCAPMFKYVMITKVSIDEKLYLYVGDRGNPLKNIMWPNRQIMEAIGQEILDQDNYVIRPYRDQTGDVAGEIYVLNKDGELSDQETIIEKADIAYAQLNMWQLNDDPELIKTRTEYSLTTSFTYK